MFWKNKNKNDKPASLQELANNLYQNNLDQEKKAERELYKLKDEIWSFFINECPVKIDDGKYELTCNAQKNYLTLSYGHAGNIGIYRENDQQYRIVKIEPIKTNDSYTLCAYFSVKSDDKILEIGRYEYPTTYYENKPIFIDNILKYLIINEKNFIKK
jgi:hypothetical protein